jgi:hypothetical protein
MEILQNLWQGGGGHLTHHFCNHQEKSQTKSKRVTIGFMSKSSPPHKSFLKAGSSDKHR